jgi:hypothetical protein
MSDIDGCEENLSTDAHEAVESREEPLEMDTVPEESLAGSSKTYNSPETGLDFCEVPEMRRRIPPRSRRVPNLLSGPALLPGPVTPNFAPASPPILAEWNGRQQPIAIFPQFMIAPNLAVGDSEEKITFVKEAMEKAVGLPPIVFDTSLGQVENLKDRRHHTRRDRYRRETIRAPPRSNEKATMTPFKSIESDFPALDGSMPVEIDVGTPSPQAAVRRTKWVKFPSKNSQIKKMSLPSL